MAEYKLKAVRTFDGNEGIVRRGDVFKVESKERADLLTRLELAEEAGADEEITHFSQMKEELSKMKKDELLEVAAADNIEVQDSDTKDKITEKILTQRETDYLKGFSGPAESEGLAGNIAGSGSSGAGAAAGATGTGSAGNSGAATGGATGGTGSTGGAGA